MSTLATAITERHWDLAAHVLIFAACSVATEWRRYNDDGGNRVRLVGLSQGGGDGKKKRSPKRKPNHS